MEDAEHYEEGDEAQQQFGAAQQIPIHIELPPQPRIYTVLEAIITCGFDNVVQRQGLTDAARVANESFDNDFNTSLYLDDTDIISEAKRYASLTQAAGKINWTVPQKNKVKALIFWVQDLNRKGLQPTLLPFLTVETSADILSHKAQLEHFTKKADQHISAVKVPPLKHENEWYNWKPQFTNLLKGIPGLQKVPLSYVIRQNPTPEPVQHTQHLPYLEQLEVTAPLRGDAYTADNAQVQLLLASHIDPKNDGVNAMLRQSKNSGDGRADWVNLCIKYEGQGLNAISLNDADRTIRTLLYDKDTSQQTFETFTGKLQKAYNAFQEFDQPYTDRQKVRQLLRMCHESTVLKSAVNLMENQIALNLANSPPYDDLVSSFRGIIANYNDSKHIRVKSTTTGNVNKNKPHSQKSNHKSTKSITDPKKLPKGDTHGHIRYDTDSKGRQVEINFLISYPKALWQSLTPAQRKLIATKAREHKGDTTGTTRTAQTVRTDTDDLSQAQTITTLQSQVTMLNNQVNALTSRVTDDVSVLSASLVGGRTAAGQHRHNINKVRVISSAHHDNTSSVKHSVPHTSALNETDSNADTCCLGSNFAILRYTNRSANVAPFHDDYTALTDVPIVSGATVYDDPNTNTSVLLIIHEGLYFGTTLDHSLLNPNQLRHFGLTYQDNPFSPEPLGITMDDLHIPLHSSGTKIQFATRCPTDTELCTLPAFELTSDHEWLPHNVNLGVAHVSSLSVEGETGVEQLYDDLPIVQRIAALTMLDLPDAPPPLGLDRKANKYSNTRADVLAGRWGIGRKWAEATLRKTSQKYFRSAVSPLERRYRADRHLSVKTIDVTMSTDTVFFTHKSLDGNKAAQIYGTSFLYNKSYPIPDSKDAHVGQTLKDLINEVGKPAKLLMDGAQVQTGTHTTFMKIIRQYGINYHISEPYRHNENPVEGNIRELKKRWYRIMVKRGVPKRLWDYGLVWATETGNMTVNGSVSSHGQPPEQLITGEVPEISPYLEFDFYDWVEYRENAGLGESCIGRWLGVSHSYGKLMSFWILSKHGNVMSRTSVARLPNLRRQDPIVKAELDCFDEAIQQRLNDPNYIIPNTFTVDDNRRVWNLLDVDDDPLFADEFLNVVDNKEITHIDDTPQEVFDPYVNVNIELPYGAEGDRLRGHVKRRACDDNNKPIGRSSDNPLLDTRAYVVEFIDGGEQVLTANIIAENILTQVDQDGHTLMLIDEILDHRTNNELLTGDDAYYTDTHGNKRVKRTTKGWEICVLWKDGSTNWIALKDLKDSYPVQLAEYSKACKINDEPAFQWWVPYVIKKKQRIISKIKSKYWDRTHKFGIKIPKSIDEALRFDIENNNNYWRDAINKEMTNAIIAFQPYHDDTNKLVGYQRIDCHWIFDIKAGENFRRKARIVAGGHRTKTPSSVTYSTVVSRDSIRICLTIAALNGMKVKTADIQNAYLTAPCREKIWCKAGSEFESFGIQKGTPLLIVRALYGLKSSGAAFRAFCAEHLDKMNYHSTTGDPDVWIRPCTDGHGNEFYEYMLVYVDDIMSVSFDPDKAINQFKDYGFTLKGGSASVPESYVGTELNYKRLQIHETDCWTLNTTKYIKNAIENLEQRLTKINRSLPTSKQAQSPMAPNYRPELDATQELDLDGITMYQELIGELRWATEMGRVDILFELSILSAYQASPRQGHLDQLLRIYGYLKYNPKITLYLDPTRMPVPSNVFKDNSHEFKEQYRDAKELLPHDMPQPRGNSVRITAYVDSDHASNQQTRRSHTGYIVFINRAPILWYSKRQNTVETSTFGSEFLAMKTVTEAIVALRAKLHWFGVPIDGPADVYADNESMVLCTRDFDTKLNKKHNAIAYHYCRQAVAAEVIRTGKVHTDFNIADPYTKVLHGPKRIGLFQSWTY